MARTHAKLLVRIWADPDFIARSAAAQRVFMLVISQPKLSTCGVIDYLPARWARFAPDTTVADIDTAVAELEAHRYVLVDRDHDELAVRSFVRNDGTCATWQMTVSMWSAWSAVVSPTLREAIVRELPDAAWTNDKAMPPPMALAMRRAIGSAIGSAIGLPIGSAMATPTPATAPAPARTVPEPLGHVRAVLHGSRPTESQPEAALCASQASAAPTTPHDPTKPTTGVTDGAPQR